MLVAYNHPHSRSEIIKVLLYSSVKFVVVTCLCNFQPLLQPALFFGHKYISSRFIVMSGTLTLSISLRVR